MKSILTKKKLWRTLAVVLLTVAILLSVVTEVAYSYSSAINYALGTSDYKVVQDDSAEETDSNYFPSDFDEYTDSDEKTAAVTAYGKSVSEEIEAEGLVLLKNADDALPLSSGTNVSLVFETARDFAYGSSGSGAIDSTKYTDLKTALEGVNLNVNETLWSFYASNPSAQGITYDRKGNPLYTVNSVAWDSYTSEAQSSISETGGTAIAVVGRLGGEGEDVSTMNSDGYDGSYLSLTAEEIGILAELTSLKESGKIDSIVVILNSAQALETAFLEDDWTVTVSGETYTVDVDACLWVGNVGIGGIFAVADALVGEVNPSGRLTDTYVKDNFASPAVSSWILQNDYGTFSTEYENSSSLSSSQLYYGVYTEGIYVGYRYYETRYEDIVLGTDNAGTYSYGDVVSRPFGYGLSYTEFSYSDYEVTENADGDYEVSVTVENTGSVAGKNSVLVYLQKPYTSYDEEKGVEKASLELVGFVKTDELKAGESGTYTVTVDRENFKTYDAYGYETYILEEGDYYLATGTDAHDALNNILAAKGRTTEDGMDYDGDADLAALVGDGVTGEKITLDTTTYEVSTLSGESVSITNRLDFCDINEYDGAGSNAVTYVSRSDWEGTFPNAKITLTVNDEMEADLENSKDLEENEEDEMPTYGASNGLSLVSLRGDVEYSDPLWDDLLDQMTWEEQSLLISSAAYGTTGLSSVTLPEVKAEDGPTGVVDSAEDVSFPSEGIWAASFNLELIEDVGDALAEDALNVGVTGMYLPGVNIHRTAFGGRAHEYFSEDPYLSGVAVEAEVNGLQGKGVIPYVKHYVFNDQEDNRIGVGIWLNEQSAREIYLKPFEYAVSPEHGNAHGVMSSFNRAGCIWTSASEALMTEILRDEFGFDGVVLTDMALGNNAYMTYDAIMYGTDLYLDTAGSSTALDAYSSNMTFRNAVRESVHRYLYVIANYSAAMNGFTSSTKTVKAMNWWQTTLVTLIIVFFVLAAAAIVLMIVAYVKKPKDPVDPHPAEKENDRN